MLVAFTAKSPLCEIHSKRLQLALNLQMDFKKIEQNHSWAE